jgi:hypothetical protein
MRRCYCSLVLQIQRFDVFDRNIRRQQIALRLFIEYGLVDEAQVEPSAISLNQSVKRRLSVLETQGEA